MKRVAVSVVALLALGACSSSVPSGPTASEPSPSPDSPSGNQSAGPSFFLPDPNASLPSRPRKLAHAITTVTRELKVSVDLWLRDGQPAPPRRAVLQALYQQRIYRKLSGRKRLTRGAISHVPAGMRLAIQRNTSAGSGLRSLVTPVNPSDLFETQRPLPAERLLRYYKKAERRFGIDWRVLAAINMIETKFGRIRSDSSAGAQGPMQFIESTWQAYGMGGNVQDPHDAIMGAANYLRASGAPEDYRRSLFAYNHSWSYVRAISSYFREMMRDPRNYYAYYNWQVFMVTTEGDVQLTGPGKDV